MRQTCAFFSVVLVLVGYACAIQFDVEVNHVKCLSEEIPVNTFVLGEYTIPPSRDQEMEVLVTDSASRIIYRKENADSGKFTFESVVPGDHRICFSNRQARGSTTQGFRRVTLNVRTGHDAKDYDELAKRENLKPLEVQLRRMEDTVIQIEREMEFLREREEHMRDTNESTNSRVAWLTVMSVVILVSLGLWQIMYLKKFFLSKKLI
mmetsp:Transcript_37353/g.60490  ORF Transcript_37353/g.60490 Transcript_37353/m.60490 type:complete len:207 (+) Transcript_37353:124-744(+)|eukprot:CAMPEP_0184650508 /NCGR_PEP_ID=MMETSP0308-20130426/8042_1 /TAXON_ID=38269 /ORGANISM="Gloeochaete witrockiana, Strain SAG 46.84" /LENGTH=206 /DNA_ID=CAMNT_0027084075 /DNA_START=106 /DNA_END=726 /DNA_ORIENTATION=-